MSNARKLKVHEEPLSIVQAVDLLSSMAEIDTRIGREGKPEISGEESSIARWLNGHIQEQNQRLIKETLHLILEHIRNLYAVQHERMKDPEVYKGIHALMVLVGEAAYKIDTYAGIFKHSAEAPSMQQLKEYRELQDFFKQKIQPKLHSVAEKEERWVAEWGAYEPSRLEIEKKGINDLESVRRDREYELFFLHKEDGTPFFNRNLLRHIKLVGDFDSLVIESVKEEDPLLKIPGIHEHAEHHRIIGILRELTVQLADFFAEALRHKEKKGVRSLIKAVMALMLASNPQNLSENSKGKNIERYIEDFQIYLRETLHSKEYQHWTAAESPGRFELAALYLVHGLCRFFFTAPQDKREILEWIAKVISKGEYAHPVLHGDSSMWTALLEDTGRIQGVLKNFPNGPLLKCLHLFREGTEKRGFDPLLHNNRPYALYTFANESFHVSVLRIPSPTHQEWINKADVAAEFMGFLRSEGPSIGAVSHLIINLQDRTSWQEHARCAALEEMAKDEILGKHFHLLTLPKQTEFYLQTGPYETIQGSEGFLQIFQEQIQSGPECGFVFPKALEKEEFYVFAEQALAGILKAFFANKNVLTVQERRNFIEIFYQYLIFFCVQSIQPQSISFTCKDAVDTGSAAAAEFYGFLRTLSTAKPWQDEEKQFLRWLLFAPALTVRERSIDLAVLKRVVSAASVMESEMEAQREEILEKTQNLLHIKNLSIEA